MVKIVRKAGMESLEILKSFVSESARERGFSDKKTKEIEIATEEAVVNIINYAYDDNTGNIEITCNSENDRRLIVEIVDTGKPFNVLSANEPDLTSDIDERPIGGLGVFFIKQFIDDVEYRRENGANVLTFIVQNE